MSSGVVPLRALLSLIGFNPSDRLRVRPGSESRLGIRDDGERELVALLDGRRTLEDVIAVTSLTAARLQRGLQRLKVLDVLEINPPLEEARPASPSPVPAPPGSHDSGAGGEAGPEAQGEAQLRDRVAAELLRVESADPHQVLGLKADAELPELQRAYYGLAREFHPDAHFGEDTSDCRTMLISVHHRHFQAYQALRRQLQSVGDSAAPQAVPSSPPRSKPSPAPAPAAAPPKPAPERTSPPSPSSSPSGPERAESLEGNAAEQFARGLEHVERNEYELARPFLELACAFDPTNMSYREQRDRVRRMLGIEG